MQLLCLVASLLSGGQPFYSAPARRAFGGFARIVRGR